MGAFDNGLPSNLSGKDGWGVTVLIYGLATQLQVGTSVTFTPTNAGTQLHGDAFLPVNFVLPVGRYTVVAWNDVNYNSEGSPNVFSVMNDGGGQISFIGSARYDPAVGVTPTLPGGFPTIIDNGPVNRYDAGTFEFQTPEPASMALIGFGFLAIAALRRRSVLRDVLES